MLLLFGNSIGYPSLIKLSEYAIFEQAHSFFVLSPIPRGLSVVRVESWKNWHWNLILLSLYWYWDCSGSSIPPSPVSACDSRCHVQRYQFYIYQELSYKNKTMKEITKLAGKNVQALVSFTNTYTYITHIMSAGHVSTMPTSLQSCGGK